ncbi:hypothetical protein JYT79_03130 [Cardiobacterium sp. AH-315-I02]|nr:hypothetical protein [Cardiobacterium sp. AH-315-I02]
MPVSSGSATSEQLATEKQAAKSPASESPVSELPASELHVIVPGLCGPLADLQLVKNSPVLKKWINTLAKSGSTLSSDNVNDVLVALFKLKINTDFPSAALTLLANDIVEASRHYMHADPVHLQADMDHAILTSSKDLEISNNESKQLCEALNQHFNQDGFRFVSLQHSVRQDKQWFVIAENEINMCTTPLVEAVARNITTLLPQGEHATRWRQLLTEAQMLMFAHEVNSTREDNGDMSINSLWFHGSGELPVTLDEGRISSVCSNHDVPKGLAKLIKCDYLTLPESVNEYAKYLLANKDNMKNNMVNILHLSEIEHLVNYTDTSLWLNKLTGLLDHWIYPLLKVAYKNNIKVTLYPCNKKQYHFSKYDYLKFWHKGKLKQHVSQY